MLSSRLQGARASQPSAQNTYFSNNPPFLEKYRELTNREWTAEQSTFVEQFVTVNRWLAECADQNKRSGRYMKCDSLRVHWIKEVALPGLTCGRHSPSKEDLDMLALPFDKAMTSSPCDDEHRTSRHTHRSPHNFCQSQEGHAVPCAGRRGKCC